MSKFQLMIYLTGFLLLHLFSTAKAEPIFHEKHYPNGDEPFPVVIALHTSGGYKTIRKSIKGFLAAGYAVYTPDFFERHRIGYQNRFETWTKYREQIEKKLVEIVHVVKSDPKINPKNIFSVGYSNGGYWAAFLAARNYVSAGVSHYGVWSWPGTHNGFPSKYFSKASNPVLALHGDKETVQPLKWVKPQIDKAAKQSSKLEWHIFTGAGHSWDCKPCKKDGFNADVTQHALDMTLTFFEKNTLE